MIFTVGMGRWHPCRLLHDKHCRDHGSKSDPGKNHERHDSFTKRLGIGRLTFLLPIWRKTWPVPAGQPPDFTR